MPLAAAVVAGAFDVRALRCLVAWLRASEARPIGRVLRLVLRNPGGGYGWPFGDLVHVVPFTAVGLWFSFLDGILFGGRLQVLDTLWGAFT